MRTISQSVQRMTNQEERTEQGGMELQYLEGPRRRVAEARGNRDAKADAKADAKL